MNLNKINPIYITDNGTYINRRTQEIYVLKPAEIVYLRKLYNNPNIARNVVLNPSMFRNKKEYRLQRKRIHRCKMIKRLMTKGLTVVIVGTIAINVGPTLLGYLKNDSAKVNAAPSEHDPILTVQEIRNPNYGRTVIPESLQKELESRLKEKSNEVEEPSEEEVLIKHICEIYHVKYDLAMQIINELTTNFTNVDYLEKSIPGITCKGENVKAETNEELFVYMVRTIKQLPEKFNLDFQNVISNSDYESPTNYYEEVAHVANVLRIDRNLLYAIIQSECGFDSEMFNTINNPGGIRNGSGDFWSFDTKEEGFYELGMEIRKYYRMIGEDPYNVSNDIIKQIGDIHAPLSDGNNFWVPNVIECYNYALEHSEEIFGPEQINRLSR